MEEDLKIFIGEYLSNRLLDPAQILKFSQDDETIFYKSFEWRRPPNEDELQGKTTSKGRRPQNSKSRISQQPLIFIMLNFKHKLLCPNHILQLHKMKTTFKGWQPQNIKSGIS